MERVLIAGMLALLISILIAPRFIAFLRRREYGAHIREEGPSTTSSRRARPCWAGCYPRRDRHRLPFALSITRRTRCRLPRHDRLRGIGFLDDYIKLTHKRSLGLNGRWKLPCSRSSSGVGFVTEHRDYATDVYLPVVNGKIPLSWAGTCCCSSSSPAPRTARTSRTASTGRSRPGIIAVFTFTSMAVIAWIRSGPPGDRNPLDLDYAIPGAALIGAIVGFLWYNAWPAEMQMGDTGSMVIGGRSPPSQS